MYHNENRCDHLPQHLPDPPGENAGEREADLRARSIHNFTPLTREDISAWLANRYPRKKAGKGSEEETVSDPL
jgi:hypothetical protein